MDEVPGAAGVPPRPDARGRALEAGPASKATQGAPGGVSTSDATSRSRLHSAISHFLFPLSLLVLLGACGSDVSTAGDYGPSTAGPHVEGGPGTLFPGLEGAPLLAAVDRGYSPDLTVGYGPARDELYGREQSTYGAVCGVYTGYCVGIGGGDPSLEADRRGVNAEHVWPQSRGARAEPLRSDLHHLFPARDNVNSSRGNAPFGDVPDAEAETWYLEDESRSSPPAADRGAWSERGAGRWEPRDDKKGDVARALFYVAAVYPDRAEPGFLDGMLGDLLAWNRADPPDDRERARSTWVAGLQGSENPFVLDPSLAPRIWARGPSRPEPGPPSTPPAGAVSIVELHYDNDGDDVGEGVELAADGVDLDGWTLVLANGNGGRVYDTVALGGEVRGRLWVDIGLQNGAPDGVALVDPAGRVVQALAYEGSFRATDGAVAGVRFRDIGASESADTPAGRSLHRDGARWVAGPATPGR